MTGRQISEQQDRWDLFKELFNIGELPSSSLTDEWRDDEDSTQVCNARTMAGLMRVANWTLWRARGGYVLNIKRMPNGAWYVERYLVGDRGGDSWMQLGWCTQFPDVLRFCEHYGVEADDALTRFAIYGAV